MPKYCLLLCNFEVIYWQSSRQKYLETQGILCAKYLNCPFPQNFHTRKLGEVKVFYAVIAFNIDVFYETMEGLIDGKFQQMVFLV